MITPLRPRFPFMSHRTLAEVDETDALLAKMRRSKAGAMNQLAVREHKRLGVLLSRAQTPDRWQPPTRA